MSRYALIGTEFITIFGLFLFAGVMLDRKFGTQPVLTLVGLAAGFAMGLYKMVTDLRRQERRDSSTDLEQKRREDRQDGPL
jgi:F0F1-type ATP synthase assembly protein I